MAENKQIIEFTGKNVKALSGWLKRFSGIDNSLLLEVDLQTSSFIAKTYNEERSVVKMSSIKFDDAGLLIKKAPSINRVKVGIFNIPRLIKILEQFYETDFSLNIKYQELLSKTTETSFAAEEIVLKNKLLKMNIECTSLNIFKYISDELFNNTIAAIDPIHKFSLTRTIMERIQSLCNLDNESQLIAFNVNNKGVSVSGKTFDYLLVEDSNNKNARISIFKEQYTSLDSEDYDVTMGEDRIKFVSKNSNTIIITSKAIES